MGGTAFIVFPLIFQALPSIGHLFVHLVVQNPWYSEEVTILHIVKLFPSNFSALQQKMERMLASVWTPFLRL